MRSAKTANRFVEISSDLLARGYGVRFRATGGSMSPAICDGDVITVGPTPAATLSHGAVVVYRRFDRLFAHRIVSIGADGSGGERLLLRGDASKVCDPPVARSQVIGEVVCVARAEASTTRRIFRTLRRASAAIAFALCGNQPITLGDYRQT